MVTVNTKRLFSEVRTLPQAHEFLRRAWPGTEASTAAWLAHHALAERLYTHVANADPDHHHEALFWAGTEHENLRVLTARSNAEVDQAADTVRPDSDTVLHAGEKPSAPCSTGPT
jgi:hypothetical protein